MKYLNIALEQEQNPIYAANIIQEIGFLFCERDDRIQDDYNKAVSWSNRALKLYE